MLGKKTLFNAITFELNTPFDFQQITYSVLVFLYFNHHGAEISVI